LFQIYQPGNEKYRLYNLCVLRDTLQGIGCAIGKARPTLTGLASEWVCSLGQESQYYNTQVEFLVFSRKPHFDF
jgi:hypothetical protein